MAFQSGDALSSVASGQKYRVGHERVRDGNRYVYANWQKDSGAALPYGAPVFQAFGKNSTTVDLAGAKNVQLWNMRGVITGNKNDPKDTETTVSDYFWLCYHGYLSSGIRISGAALALSSIKGISGAGLTYGVSDTIASGAPTYENHIVVEQANTDAVTARNGWVYCTNR